ncbi:MAG: YeeE/YedE thiosulfate transporter family protein, partial [Pseudolabrys sp.]
MSTASLAASGRGAAVRIDRLFLGLALGATAILIALVLLDHQPASAALVLGGFGLGIAFLKAEFSYTASWRRFVTRGDASGLLGGLIVIVICALVVVPVAALSPKYGGAIAPLGPSLVIGAFVFGVGMQLANGCGSGTLYTVGGGSGRMLIALLFFVIGSVFGSLSLPAFLALG